MPVPDCQAVAPVSRWASPVPGLDFIQSRSRAEHSQVSGLLMLQLAKLSNSAPNIQVLIP